MTEHPDYAAVSAATILAGHRERTLRRMQGQSLSLLVQDGTDLNFATPGLRGSRNDRPHPGVFGDAGPAPAHDLCGERRRGSAGRGQSRVRRTGRRPRPGPAGGGVQDRAVAAWAASQRWCREGARRGEGRRGDGPRKGPVRRVSQSVRLVTADMPVHACGKQSASSV